MKRLMPLFLILVLCTSGALEGLALRPMVIEERRCDIEVKKLYHQMEKRHGLKLLVDGLGVIIDSSQARWSVSFMSKDALTVDQVRPMITDIAKALYQLVHTDPKFLSAENLHRECYNMPLLSQLDPEYVGIKITFWDQNVNRMQQPAVAQVIFTDKTITYRFADPETQALINPIVETLDLTRPQA